MAIYYHIFDNVVSGEVKDTYKTIASIIASATSGYKARLLGFNIGPSHATPADENFSIKINRIDDVSAGGAGTSTAVSAANMSRPLSDQRDGVITGAVNYTAEPTVYNTQAILTHGMNMRGGFAFSWDRDTAPCINNDQLIGLLVTSREGVTARYFSGSFIYEEF